MGSPDIWLSLLLGGVNTIALIGFAFNAGKLVNRIEHLEVHYSRYNEAADSVIKLLEKVDTLEERFTVMHKNLHDLRNDIMTSIVKGEHKRRDN